MARQQNGCSMEKGLLTCGAAIVERILLLCGGKAMQACLNRPSALGMTGLEALVFNRNARDFSACQLLCIGALSC